MVGEEFQLDLKTIQECALLYDSGDQTSSNKLAKMIWMAYESGYDDGVLDSEENMHYMNILMFGESGHA
jgi:hypothetical protein